jgi:hypothetical protein
MASKKTYYLILFICLIGIFELAGFLTRFIDDDMYDHREEVLAEVDEAGLAQVRGGGMDPVLGWKSYGPRVTDDCNCQGTRVEYVFDQFGAREYSGYEGASAEIIVIGDSYSHGHEVAADDTYVARLSEILGVSLANHAYGGYGPLQAFLSLKENVDHYPRARIAILGIMYENIFRMVNSYRPLLITKGTTYALKPYMKGENIQPHPGQDAFKDVDTFKGHVNDAFDNDFWARPKHRFPFFVSYIRALGTPFYYFKKLPRKLRKVGVPEFSLAYRSDAFAQELVALLNMYAEFARERNLVPVVIFIPRDKYDRTSVGRFLEENRERLPKDLLVGDVGTVKMKWDRYNLLDMSEPDNLRFCHPSPYGHKEIAAYIADFLAERKVWPSDKESRFNG